MAVRTSTDVPPWEQFDPVVIQGAVADIQLKFRTNFLHRSTLTNVDIRDLNLIQNDPNFVKNFVLQEYYIATDPSFPSNTAIYQNVLKALEFRHEYHIHDLTARDIPPLVLRAGFCYTHGVDKQGNSISYLIVRKNSKSPELKKASKLYAAYLVYRHMLLCPDQLMTLLIDCTGAGLSNMDLDLIRFLINLFRYYFPLRLGWMLVHNMPWVLTATWNLVKRWLPPKSRDRIVFTSPTDISIYVSADQLLAEYGGNMVWKYQYPVPAHEADTLLGRLIYIGERDGEESALLKSFESTLDNGKIMVGDLLESIDSVDPVSNAAFSPLTPILSSKSFKQEMGNQNLVDIYPKDVFVFSLNDASKPNSCIIKISVKNVSSSSLSFKLKSTNLIRYKVSPTMGVIEPGCTCKIGITLLVSERMDLATLCRDVARDRFLIMIAVYPFDRATTPGHTFRFWKKLDEDEYMNYIFNSRCECDSVKELVLEDQTFLSETTELIRLKSEFTSLQTVLSEVLWKHDFLWYILLLLFILFLFNSCLFFFK